MSSEGAAYSFVTVWRVEAPIDAVWEALFDAHAYPRWWKAVLSVEEVEPGAANGLGKVDRFAWRAPLGYRLRFSLRLDTVDRPSRLGGPASGELQGTGYWTLREEGGFTRVQHDWKVRTNRRLMNLLAPIARPVFASSHKVVMHEGATGLAGLLHVRVLEGDAETARPQSGR
ncbi:MAG: SRPBCC family protein [Candidatus Dormibacteraeota bacterium]|nr:SRPBCC family protein [Candidatus Dormibacteraeota bacterium]